MKILIVSPYFYPKIGGVEKHTFYIAKGLKARGHDVIVVTSNHMNKKYIEEKIEGLRVIRLPLAFKFSNTPLNPIWYFKLKKIIKTEKPDIIEAHSPVPGMADMAFLARGRTPYVIKYHAGSMKKGNPLVDSAISLYEGILLKRILMRADAIMSVYPDFLNKLIRKKRHVHFIPPGVDTSDFKPNLKAAKTTDVLYVGRIERASAWKGIKVLLESIAMVATSKPDVTLTLVGSGDAIEDYKSLAQELGIQDNVCFKGALYNKELVAAYTSSKMLVLPSLTEAESFGNVLLEAMACGIPVIGSNVGGIPNVIKDHKNGLLAPPNDAVSLARSIEKILASERLARALGKHGRKYVEDNFSTRNLIDKTEKLLEEIAAPKVIHVAAHYSPHIGGMQKVVESLAYNQADQGTKVSVTTSNLGYKQGYLDRTDVKRLKSVEIAHTPIIPGLLFSLLRSPSNVIFHVHVAQAGIPEIAFIAAKIKKVPVVMHVHADVEASSIAGKLLPIYKKFFLGYVLRHAEAVIVPTEAYKEKIATKYSIKKPIHVVPGGVEKKFFIEKSQNNKTGKVATLLSVGRLSVQKNIPLLIKAVSKVQDPVEFIIVGGGPLRSKLEKLAEDASRKGHTIKLVGSKTSDELVDYYSSADVFVLASHYESQALVVLEAMASGTPAIVANIPAVSEVVEGAAILVNKTSEAFARAIEELIHDDKLKNTLRDKGRIRANEFQWSQTVVKLDRLYAGL